ncbi:MAG: chorismate synthase [Bacteroidota bacterium]|jgi:chorismate synthase
MIEFHTAGESHGKGLITIITGFPSNIKIKPEYINAQLKRRQAGYGRGLRMKIESDQVEIISGIRFGKTIGSPISMIIWNKDWQNWKDMMSIEEIDTAYEKISIPRPGHADLVGVTKYNYDDIRNSIERASARETAARVAACSIAKRLLEEFGIYVGSYVESIGGISGKNNFNPYTNIKIDINKISKTADKSSVRVLDMEQEERIVKKIKTAKKKGDTLGGTFYVIATGVPVGLGSYASYNTRLEADLSHAIMSINAVKGVEIGDGFNSAMKYGSEVHDEIVYRNNQIIRKTNRAGGIEGGISNGMPLIIRASMKPIATLMKPIATIDLKKNKPVEARRERSDFVAVPACSVIAESMTAWVLAKRFLEKFGGDSIEETRDNYKNYVNKIYPRLKKNFLK